jgi:hypothetical protein
MHFDFNPPPDKCPVCGERLALCKGRSEPMSIVDRPQKVSDATPPGGFLSTERVYEEDATGVSRLKYAVGDPVDEAEARRQGMLVGNESQDEKLQAIADAAEKAEADRLEAEKDAAEKAIKDAPNKARKGASNKS